jgi:hypothetical protein
VNRGSNPCRGANVPHVFETGTAARIFAELNLVCEDRATSRETAQILV